MSSNEFVENATGVPLAAYRRVLATYLGPQRRQVRLLAALLAGSIALQLLNPQIIRRFLDAAQAGAPGGPDQGGLALAGLAFIAIGLLQSGLNLATVYAGENVGWRATNALRADLTGHTLRLDLPFHKQHTPGELIERIDGDAMALGNFFSQFVVRILGSALLVLGVLVLLFAEDWRLGLGLSLYAALTLLILGALQGVAAPRWARLRQAAADMYGYIEERYNGTEDIRSSGAEAYVMHGLNRLLAAVMRRGQAAQFTGALTSAATRVLFLAGYAVGLALGAYLYLHSALTIGGAYVVIYYVGMLAAPLETMRGQIQDLGQARASLGRALGLLNLHSALVERAAARLPAGPLAVALEDVAFAYDDGGAGLAVPAAALPADGAAGALPRDGQKPSGEPSEGAGEAPGAQGGNAPGAHPREAAEFALRDVSFTLPAGRVLGLLGRTGSGKTTLTSLLFRLYDPRAGCLRLGGTDLRALALDDLRSRVGMITQDVQLYQASIRDNLACFNRGISDAQIEAALRELGLWSWVQGLPAGLDTQLGAGGQGLSAGEAQLLAFARVFLKDPGLVVLDEASSRLDPATERLLEQAIGRLLRGRTGIIIAHRLHTVQRADDILIMSGGRILEFGPRAALAADPQSHFYHLLRTGLEEALA